MPDYIAVVRERRGHSAILGGSRVRIGQDTDGVQLAVLDGRVRIRRGGAELR